MYIAYILYVQDATPLTSGAVFLQQTCLSMNNIFIRNRVIALMTMEKNTICNIIDVTKNYSLSIHSCSERSTEWGH